MLPRPPSNRQSAASNRRSSDQLLGLDDPGIFEGLAFQAELLVEHAQSGIIQIGDLPEVEDAGVVEAQFELAVDAGDALEVVSFTAGGFDAFELAWHRFHAWVGHGTDVDAGVGLAAGEAVKRGLGDEVAVQRDGAARVVVAWDREVDAVRVAVGIDDGDDGEQQVGLGLTQEQFALRFGIDVDALQNWEQGRCQPDKASASYLRAIAAIPRQVAEAQEEELG